MDTLTIYSEMPVPTDCYIRYSGIAYDGCSFYLTKPTCCQIIKFDKCFKKTGCFKTCRKYTCICYDRSEKCFWAAAEYCYCTLFKLNCCFQEIDCIHVRPCYECGCIITGVSYNCELDKLLISYTNCILLTTKENYGDVEIYSMDKTRSNTQILSISPYYLYTYLKDSSKYLVVCDHEHTVIHTFTLPSSWVVKGLIFYPCIEQEPQKLFLYVFILKNGCYPYVMCIELHHDEFCQQLHPCNFIFDCCDDCCPPPPCCDPCDSIIESIAHVETAIAHILNAEGEKIQKVVSSSDDVCHILETNKSVNKTITNVTLLEQVLYSKLATLADYCDFDCCDCCDCCDCDDICNKYNDPNNL